MVGKARGSLQRASARSAVTNTFERRHLQYVLVENGVHVVHIHQRPRPPVSQRVPSVCLHGQANDTLLCRGKRGARLATATLACVSAAARAAVVLIHTRKQPELALARVALVADPVWKEPISMCYRDLHCMDGKLSALRRLAKGAASGLSDQRSEWIPMRAIAHLRQT